MSRMIEDRWCVGCGHPHRVAWCPMCGSGEADHVSPGERERRAKAAVKVAGSPLKRQTFEEYMAERHPNLKKS